MAIKVTATGNTTLVKKIVVGTPVKSVTAQNSINSITDFNTSDKQHLDIFLYDSNLGKYTSVGFTDSSFSVFVDDDRPDRLTLELYNELGNQGDYGDSNNYPIITVDKYGRVSAASTLSLPDLVNSVADSAYIQSRLGLDEIEASIIPDSDEYRSLGSPTRRFKDLWLAGDTLYIGRLALKDVDGSLQIQAVNRFGVVEQEIGTISGGPGGLTSENISDAVDIDLSGTAQQLLDTFSMGSFRSAKYFVQIEDNANNNFGSAELLLVHDSAEVYLLEFARISTGPDLGEFDATVDQFAETVDLLFTPTSSTVSVKAKRLISGI